MKISALLSLLVLVVTPVAAQRNGVSVSTGEFSFDTTGARGAIQYDARLADTTATGQITFTGETEVSLDDVDGTESADGGNTTIQKVAFTITVDCVNFRENRAAMSGLITSSNVASYQGIRALLAVEDRGEGRNNDGGDKFTWGVYHPASVTWTPSDAEVEGDTGASLTWLATDAEREEDPESPAIPGRPSTVVDCKSFPLSAYGFVDLAKGAGNIQVRP